MKRFGEGGLTFYLFFDDLTWSDPCVLHVHDEDYDLDIQLLSDIMLLSLLYLNSFVNF